MYETTDNITKGILPYNDISKTLFYNKRIILDASLVEPLAWRVTKAEPFAMRGNIMYTFKQDVFNQHYDYIEYDDNDNVVGMWADYYSNSNLPSYMSEPDLDGKHAEITYAGKDPHIKVGGSYKAVTITYYNVDEPLNDQTPGDWSYWIDDTDVSDLLKVLETDSPNTIKIKFLGDEEYLGKVLTVKNIRDQIVAELRLEIVSL